MIPPIRQDGDILRKLYAVPNKQRSDKMELNKDNYCPQERSTQTNKKNKELKNRQTGEQTERQIKVCSITQQQFLNTSKQCLRLKLSE